MSANTVTISSDRKKFSGTKVPMPVTGKCPVDECTWVCKSMNQSTFSEHIRRKHAADFGRESHPYGCEKCTKRFTAKTHLNHHISNHHNISFHECPSPDCSYLAKNKASLYSHYGNKHMKEIKQLCSEQDICVSCGKEDIKKGMSYHIAVCCPESLLYKKK
tara:strand:+ start:3328 stop:3810 length:483 start_codon:yes stop_codon:yes gene_type:complete